jgi:hypothetical protein
METTLLRFGKAQLEHWFNYNDQKPLDDSEFVPLLDMLIDTFAQAGLSAALVECLRRHACDLFHRHRLQVAPETTFEENAEIMFSYLPPPLRLRWQEALA